MVKSARIGRSVILNWLALGVGVSVAFFLSPLVVHRLGNVGYGIWTLINSMVAYMGLLDLGLRGAVTRFVSQHHAHGEHSESSRAVSAAFWFRVGVAALVIMTSLVLPGIGISVFHIPQEMQVATRWAIAMMGFSFAVTLTCGVFGGVLVALHRFDLVSAVTIVQTLLRAGGIVWMLNSGYGIVGLATWELIIAVLANFAITALAFRVYRELKGLIRPDAATLRKLWGYSFYSLVFNICAQIVYYTDNVVVGAFLSAGMVTFFTIAGGLLDYARQVVSGLGTVFLPVASSLDAQGRKQDLRRLLIQGTRATLLVSLPLQTALFFRGHTFISLWVGEEYGNVSGRILQILLIAHAFAIANYTSFNIVWGLGKHKPVALIAIAEATANLALSIVLVRQIGLEGVAWGTVMPSLAIQLVFWPRYIAKTLETSAWEYISQGWIRPAVAVLPFAIACYLANRTWAAPNMLSFFGQMAVLMPILIVGILFSFPQELCSRLRQQTEWFTRRLDAARFKP